jgi:cell division protein FtsQ
MKHAPAPAPRWMEIVARLCFGLALLVVAGTALAWVAQRPAFDFRRIEVRGHAGELRHVSQAALRSAVGGRMKGNFFTMRLDETRRLFETVPWVAGASVRRVWPDRLVVTLTEHRALGVWGDGRVLSDQGRLFVANVAEAEVYGPLIEFDGPPQYALEAARRFYEFSAVLAPLSIEIERMAVSERASWSVRAVDGQRIELGRDDPPGQLRTRLALIDTSYPLMLAKFGGPPARIDARYPNGLAAATPLGTRLAPASVKKP